MSDKAFHIVGQGLAGSVLALTLDEAGCNVHITDDGHLTAASSVAAGMFNPVNFRRFKPGWYAPQLLPAMLDFYGRWERRWGATLLHSRDIVRIFRQPEQRTQWLSSCELNPHFFSPENTDDLQGIRLHFEDGYGVVKEGGFLDVKLFLALTREYFKQKNALTTSSAPNISPEKDTTTIYCEGYRGASNPLFSWLPFSNVKGETVEISSAGLPEKNITSGGVWIIPRSENTYRVGATFTWDDLSPAATVQGLETLEREISQLCTATWEVISQAAGVRPATRDRRPFTGLHPDYPQIGIFNGLGTKGVMLAPWVAADFTSHLLNGSALHPETDIRRFIKYLPGHAKN